MDMQPASATECPAFAGTSAFRKRGLSMKPAFCTILALLASAATMSAITVTAPVNGSQVTSPFSLDATTISCNTQSTVAMGYSLDYGATIIVPQSLNASSQDAIAPYAISSVVVAGEGEHILHVKCWGPHGAAGSADENITVIPANSPPPSNVTVVSNIQSLTGWVWKHDPGTPGNAEGSSDLVTSPSLHGNSRKYSLRFTNSGGEIYHISFGRDLVATHFVYSADIWLADPSGIANIEMDMNQVLANGDTVIYGFQCDGYSGTWDYTLNFGTPANPEGHWVHSNVPCPDPKKWTPDAWHNVEVSYHRDDAGNVTYDSVVFDGEQSDLVGATGNSAFSLGWGATLLTNFQIDGHGENGSVTAYVDNLTISRW
jgi:hypothetical protein